MPFQKGQVANPYGTPPRAKLAFKWNVIDNYVSASIKKAFDVVDGVDKDYNDLTDPKDRLDAKLKAIGHILRLAPQRHAGESGGAVLLSWEEPK